MKLSEYEWEKWKDLVEVLKSTKAVTEEDCSSYVSDLPETPGEMLFEAIRIWGEALANLRIAEGTKTDQEVE